MIDKIQEDLKTAMINKNKTTVNTLRGILATIKNQGKDLTNIEIINIFKKEVKKRKEAIELYSSNNRNDLKEIEEMELKVLNSYLPEQVSEDELEAKIVDLKNSTFKDKEFNLGELIKISIQKFNAVSDNGTISKICKKVIGD
tara:strand:- start:1 stop:429 length:429 start_codon:yes stop_codon:yes gene_type:complete